MMNKLDTVWSFCVLPASCGSAVMLSDELMINHTTLEGLSHDDYAFIAIFGNNFSR